MIDEPDLQAIRQSQERIESMLRRLLDSPPTPAVERLASKPQACAHFGVSPTTVGVWLRKGAPCVRTRGQVRFRLTELEAWLAEHQPARKGFGTR
jgi:hypothetical protein